MSWRPALQFGKSSEGNGQQKRGDMSAEALQAFLALAIGFAFAAAMATGYQLAVSRPPSFQMLSKRTQRIGLCRRAVPGVCRALSDCPLTGPRRTCRPAGVRPGDGRDDVRWHLEPDVGHRVGDDVSGGTRLAWVTSARQHQKAMAMFARNKRAVYGHLRNRRQET